MSIMCLFTLERERERAVISNKWKSVRNLHTNRKDLHNTIK